MMICSHGSLQLFPKEGVQKEKQTPSTGVAKAQVFIVYSNKKTTIYIYIKRKIYTFGSDCQDDHDMCVTNNMNDYERLRNGAKAERGKRSSMK